MTTDKPIAALFVKTGGVYFNLPGVDPWDEKRDARRYEGNAPVVAHPPCQRWGKMWMGSPSYVARTGIRKKLGNDDGCFESALENARRCGGVIEHPWAATHGSILALPCRFARGGWIKADDFGGWTCCVEQGKYGHYVRKPTLLLVYGVPKEPLPELEWGHTKATYPQWAIDKYGLEKCKRAGEMAFKGGGKDSSARISTPIPFRDLLISIVRSVYDHR